MPINPAPTSYLSSELVTMKRQIADLAKSVGRPTDQVRDLNDNVLTMPGTANPAIVGRNHDAGISFLNGTATITDGQGQSSRPLNAQQFNGPLQGDSTGTHHGDVGTPTETHNHYGDLHGNAYGFHYGPVGDGTTQNQINALAVFATDVHVTGRFYGEVGVPGTGPFFTTYGDVGNGSNFFNLFGTVHAPSERGMKDSVAPLDDAGRIIDQVESYRWRWKPDTAAADDYDHAGPMVDDVADVAPWLVRQDDDESPRMLTDRDLIGVLWAALRESRERIAALEQKVKTQ
jgi:Chaperone of endosialidase